jgi:plasmid stabilization system protein ParE
MSFEVINTARAEADILRNAHWWAEHHSKPQAVVWVNTLRQQFRTLAEMPERFSLAPENEQFGYEIRQMLVGPGNKPSFRAIYTIVDQSVFVLTVRRGAEAALRVEDLPDSVDSL